MGIMVGLRVSWTW